MKAFMVYEPNKYELVDVEIPVIKDDEVLIKVGAASICHSDLDILEGRRKHYIKFPVIPGHEFAGTIAETGRSVIGLQNGDRVTSECVIWCGVCRNCRRGFTGQCLSFNEIGTMENGGFAEYVAVPYKMIHKFQKMTMDQASNIEPIGNAYHAVDAAGIIPGDTIVIIGPGSIGLYALQIAKLKSPSQVIIVGTRDNRLDIAKQLGATEIININKTDAFDYIMNLTNGKGVDKVIQCATTDSAFELSLKIAGINSKIVIEGLSGTGKGTMVNFDDFVIKPMSIIGVAGADGSHFANAIELMELGMIETKRIITHSLKLDNIIEGFEMLKSRNDGAIKVVINP